MRNSPKFIYLQTGLEDNSEICEDFYDLQTDFITWCADKVHSDDLEYISVSFLREKIEEKIKIREDLKNNKMCSKAEYNAYCRQVNPIINTLKDLIANEK